MTPPGTRRGRLEATTNAAGRRSVLVTARSSVRYLSGFTGSAGALWIPLEGPPVLVTDFRYEEQVRLEVAGPIRAHIGREGWIRGIAEVAADAGGPIAFEAESVTVADYESLRDMLPDIVFVPLRDLVGTLRRVKSRDEVDAIERAVAVAEGAFNRLLSSMEWSAAPSEREIATALEMELRRGGSDPLPFDPIVAAGERSALPHATPTARRVEPGDLLLMDFGARVDGYCSDLTRTLVRGTPEPWQATLHEQVLEAQTKAREVIGNGVACREVDLAVRTTFARHDMDGFFGHGTGHGIGLDVHEGPSLSSRSEDVLEPGNVVTVEPGLYLPGRGGVRIEDDVRIGEAGARTLTRLPRALVRL
ncbi:MAG: Xaa-Pro peptidase family protein [Gemmatimonadota bacterium]|uniref:M24 family metallopeptidase n=1 Tax=Candidatus Palauibacter scopulicola TaxID=3056741 RepID=UPI0023974F40|nr:Xaa-Pro peptidase family protein [Candidatus Palauibacter scopulicola]MDE2662299.1 Xaa-Pro peptidase family protein [Candidatus Palauibacter scopulicola]